MLGCPCPPPHWEQAGARGVRLSHRSTRAASAHRETDLGDGEEDEREKGATLGKMKALGDRGRRRCVRQEDVQRDLGVVESW